MCAPCGRSPCGTVRFVVSSSVSQCQGQGKVCGCVIVWDSFQVKVGLCVRYKLVLQLKFGAF
jgi:hypothetical protein